MTAYKHYFIVGTDDLALHDTMNGTVTGELISCKDCKHHHGTDCEVWDYRKTEDDKWCAWAEREE